MHESMKLIMSYVRCSSHLPCSFVLLVVFLSHTDAVSVTFTPVNKFSGCIAENTAISAGSKCFAKSATVFGGKRKVKKHNFVKYVIETCPGVTLPYSHTAKYEDVRKRFYDSTEWGDWRAVNGTAQVGDILVTTKHMGLIESIGKYKLILYNGKKVGKNSDSAIWEKINKWAKTKWKVTQPWVYDTTIDPIKPSGECRRYSWRTQALSSNYGNYWRPVRTTSSKVGRWKAEVKSDKYRVFRYVDKTTSDAVAFSAAFDLSTHRWQIASVQTILDYNPVLNNGSRFVNSKLAATGGVYFGSVSVGVKAGYPVSLVVEDAGTDIGIWRESEVHEDTDQLSRTLLLPLDGNTVCMTYRGYVDTVCERSCVGINTWSMADLSGVMTTLVAFSVGSMTYTNVPGRLTFEDVMYDPLDVFSATTNEFSAPADGLYFFSLNVGVNANEGAEVHLLQNGAVVQKLIRESLEHNFADTISTVYLGQAVAGDVFSVELVAGAALGTADYKLVAWSGWLYLPVFSPATAWSVHTLQDAELEAKLDPLPFEVVRVNEGSVWDSAANMVTIATSGVYYVHLTMATIPGAKIDAYVKKTPSIPGWGPIVLRLLKVAAHQEGTDQASHGAMVHCQAGDNLWVVAEAGDDNYYGYAGDAGDDVPVTSFTGVLIQPDV